MSASNEYSAGGSPAPIAAEPERDGARGVCLHAGGEHLPDARAERRHVDVVEVRGRDALRVRRLAREPLVEAKAAVEHVLRPGPDLGPVVEARRHRDRQQSLLRERPGAARVPALEAVAGVPVQVAAVGPVGADDVLHPRAQQAVVLGRQQRHPGAHGLLVEEDEVARLARVLGAVEVERMRRRPVRQVVEPVAGPEVGRAARRQRARDAVAEPRHLRAVVVDQQLVVAGDGRGVRVQLAVPVDLVEAHVREAEERAARGTADAVGDQVERLLRQVAARRARATRTSAPRRPSGRSTCPSPSRACRGSRPSRGCGTAGRPPARRRARSRAATGTAAARARARGCRCGPGRRDRPARRPRASSAAGSCGRSGRRCCCPSRSGTGPPATASRSRARASRRTASSRRPSAAGRGSPGGESARCSEPWNAQRRRRERGHAAGQHPRAGLRGAQHEFPACQR